MPQANFADGTKVCSSNQCALAGQPQPLTNFTRDKNRADGLKSNCDACRKKTKKGPLRSPEWNARKKQEKEEQLVAQRTSLLVTGLNKAIAQEGTLTEELARQVEHAFGGLDKIASGLVETARTANETTRARIYQTVISLFKDASDKQQARQVDVGTVSDEVIEQRIRDGLLKLAVARGHVIDGELANKN